MAGGRKIYRKVCRCILSFLLTFQLIYVYIIFSNTKYIELK